MTILSLIVDFKMRRRYTDQGAGTYSKHDDLTMSFGGSSLPSVAYSKNNSYICSEDISKSHQKNHPFDVRKHGYVTKSQL